MKQFMLILIASALLLFLSCKDKSTGHGDGMNPNIILIRSCCDIDLYGGDFRMAVWSENHIYATRPLRDLLLPDDIRFASDSILILYGRNNVVSIDRQRKRLLFIRSSYSDVSLGAIFEMSLATGNLRELRDSTYNVSSAHYLPGDTAIVYYSYGHPVVDNEPGYYYLSFKDGRDSFILPYISEVGPSEVINGFDLSPDGRKLLFPINYTAHTPKAVEFDMVSRTFDTIRVEFARQMLWLRYNPLITNQIVYCNYPRGSGGFSVSDDSEIGIIAADNSTKRILDVNTNPGGLSVSLFPNWSPDGKHIVYGSSRGPATEPPGAIGRFSLYVLKNVN